MTTGTLPNEPQVFEALKQVVAALDRRFPDGSLIFQRVSRLAEECGELASAVNHREGMGVKQRKYGVPDDQELVKELQDVLRTVLGIAKHYGLEDALEESIIVSYYACQREGYIKRQEN